MRKCMINWISLSFVGIGCFLLGGATGLAMSKDEEDIWAEDAIKLSDLFDNDDDEEDIVTYSRESYSRMASELYGDLSPEARLLLENTVDHEDLFDDDEEEIEDPEEHIFDSTIQEIDINGSPEKVKLTSEGMLVVVPPYLISEDDYFNENEFSEFFKENLIYYEKDGVLSTDRDEVIYDVENVIGDKALNSFGHHTDQVDCVYVRNIERSTDYEITRDEGSYQETVLGFSDEDEIDYKKAKQFFKKFDEEREE